MEDKAQIGSGGRGEWWSGRGPVLVAAMVIAVVLIGGSAWFYVYTARHKSAPNNVTLAQQTAAKDMQAGNYQKALSELQKVEGQATTNAQKSSLYLDMAAAAATVGQPDLALHYYDLRHKADVSTVQKDAYSVGGLYERVGDNKKAVEQYKIALTYIKSQPNADQKWPITQGLQSRIDSLGGN